MDSNSFNSLYEHIKNIGKSYYAEENATKDAQEKLKETLEAQMGFFPLEDQAQMVSRLKKESFIEYRLDETTGYGIIRDVYCEHLLDELMSSAKIKLANIQGGAFSPENLDNKIKEQLRSLDPAETDAFSRTIENYQTPLNLDKTSKERDEFAWREVNNLMQAVLEEERTSPIDNFNEF